MWGLIFIGYVIDWLIVYTANISGKINPTVAIIVALWLICNELISLTENMNDIGVPVPKFLTNVLQNTYINKKGRD